MLELLKQYEDITTERRDLQRRIDAISRSIKELESVVVSDTVEGTRQDGTYGAIKITGIPLPEMDARRGVLRKKREKYESLSNDLENVIQAIESAVEAVTDPSVRTIIRLRYIDGMKWEKVAGQMGMTADQCRKRATRYFEKENLKSTCVSDLSG